MSFEMHGKNGLCGRAVLHYRNNSAAGLTKAQLVSAINDGNFDDFEDSMQHGSALSLNFF